MRPSRRYRRLFGPIAALAGALGAALAGALGAALLLGACGNAPVGRPPASPASGAAMRTTTSATSPTGPESAGGTAAPVGSTTSTPVTTTAVAPPFRWSESGVTAAQLGATWHDGCPVGPARLRLLSLSYRGFDLRPHTGSMVVNESVVSAVVQVFSALYAAGFPIREMVPQSYYGGNDNAAAAADDTSGFNCRDAVTSGPPQWSVHAYGEAIDVNDVENPYVDGSDVIPPAGAAYENRGDVRPGMAVTGGELVDAFASVGWHWGGRWASTPDYQHFSATGG